MHSQFLSLPGSLFKTHISSGSWDYYHDLEKAKSVLQGEYFVTGLFDEDHIFMIDLPGKILLTL